MDEENGRRALGDLISRYNRDPDDELVSEILVLVGKFQPEMLGHLERCQCAYEFHMILESIRERCKERTA